MVHRVTLIPGDGTGPELVAITRRVLEATGVEFSWDVQDAGADVMDRYGTPLPDAVVFANRPGGSAIENARTGADGKAVLRGLPAAELEYMAARAPAAEGMGWVIPPGTRAARAWRAERSLAWSGTA